MAFFTVACGLAVGLAVGVTAKLGDSGITKASVSAIIAPRAARIMPLFCRMATAKG
jgi:hypothetical protein